jgi:PAS domain S-box-containing protein
MSTRLAGCLWASRHERSGMAASRFPAIFLRLAASHPSGLTAAALAVATLIRLAFTPVFGNGYTFITFYPAIMFGTVIGGWRYGLAATLVSALLSVLLFIDPTMNPEHATAILLFLSVNAMMILIADAAGRARRQAELQASLAQAREDGLREEISARQRAEEALRNSELKFRTLTEVPPQIVWMTDATGYITYVNPYCVNYTGFTLEQVQQLPAGTPVHPDDHEAVMAAFRKSLETGEPFLLEERLRAADGSYRWFLCSGTPVRNERGEIEHWIGICVDIHERKQAEQRLRESLAQLRTATDIARLATYSWDPATGALQWDERLKAMFGLPPDADVDYGIWLNAVHPADRDRVLAAVAKAVDPSGDGIYEAEYRAIGIQDGVERWVAARGQTFFADDHPSGFVGTAMEITERKQAEAALRHSEER